MRLVLILFVITLLAPVVTHTSLVNGQSDVTEAEATAVGDRADS